MWVLMPPEPAVKRAVVFVDGQNLFHTAREAFGYTYPNYDVLALAQAVCAPKGWALTQTRSIRGSRIRKMTHAGTTSGRRRWR